MLFVKIGGVNGYAYVNTGAKANIASSTLYQKLIERGYTFTRLQVKLSLTDGVAKIQTVLIVQAEVKLSGHMVPTTILVLLESRDKNPS